MDLLFYGLPQWLVFLIFNFIMSSLQFKSIHYKYASGTLGLRDVSFHINKGSKVVLMGCNGSGKSTLFLTLAGVLKPNSGEYRIQDKVFKYCKKHRYQLCQTIGYVFQDPDVQVVSTHVKDDVAYGLRNLGMKEDEVEQRVNQYLALVGIQHLKEKTIHALSYGQKKQVALAGVLAMEPEIIMLDEPFAWLDYKQAQRLKLLLNQLSEQGKTLIVSTHDSNFALEWGQQALVMEEGKLAVDSPVKALMANKPLIEKLELEPPRGCS